MKWNGLVILKLIVVSFVRNLDIGRGIFRSEA